MKDIKILSSNPSILEGVEPGQALTVEQLFESILQLVKGESKQFVVISPLTNDDIERVVQSAVVVGLMAMSLSVNDERTSVIVNCTYKKSRRS